MKIAAALVCLCCLLSVTSHAAKIYKWRGPDGQVHYSSTPPPEVEAETTGKNTTTRQTRPSASDSEIEKEDDEKSGSDEERIRQLEERIKQLEEGNAGKGKKHDPASMGEQNGENLADEDVTPDYSIEGQVRMLEQEKRRQKMMARCRAKAPHGVDCKNPEGYQQY